MTLRALCLYMLTASSRKGVVFRFFCPMIRVKKCADDPLRNKSNRTGKDITMERLGGRPWAWT